MFSDNTTPRIVHARAKLNYRILVMPTGQIKWADDVEAELNANELKALRGDEVAACDALIDVAARAVCAQALGNIYPVRVVKVLESGEVVLGEGGTLRREGELFDVYQLGEVLVDAYSKESLGREESRIARIQVVRVESKLSYANIVEGAIPAEAVPQIACCVVRRGLFFPFKKNTLSKQKKASVFLSIDCDLGESAAGRIVNDLPAFSFIDNRKDHVSLLREQIDGFWTGLTICKTCC